MSFVRVVVVALALCAGPTATQVGAATRAAPPQVGSSCGGALTPPPDAGYRSQSLAAFGRHIARADACAVMRFGHAVAANAIAYVVGWARAAWRAAQQSGRLLLGRNRQTAHRKLDRALAANGG